MPGANIESGELGGKIWLSWEDNNTIEFVFEIERRKDDNFNMIDGSSDFDSSSTVGNI